MRRNTENTEYPAKSSASATSLLAYFHLLKKSIPIHVSQNKYRAVRTRRGAALAQWECSQLAGVRFSPQVDDGGVVGRNHESHRCSPES